MEQIIRQLQDMTYLSWAKARNSSGTAGSFLKAYDENASGKTYYKLSNYDAWAGIVGHEWLINLCNVLWVHGPPGRISG